MKLAIMLLGSTVFVAGGTAITSQQDVRNNGIENRYQIQKNVKPQGGGHRMSGVGACCLVGTCVDGVNQSDCYAQGGEFSWNGCATMLCVPECEDAGVFSDIAQAIELSCKPMNSSLYGYEGQESIDLDGDGVVERKIGHVNSYFEPDGPVGPKEYNSFSMLIYADDSPAFLVKTLLNAHPDNLTYIGLQGDFDNGYSINALGYIDVTGDGLPDSLLKVSIPGSPLQFFYVENISPPPAAACATDINNDGSTNVTDLLALVGNWGPCE